ncbi:MAG: hypothetical protein SynsKO_44500 [Synoicihabitans sp.]
MGGSDTVTAAELPQLFGKTVHRIHAIGVGGMGLGPLAIYLAQRGWSVTGEDDSLSPVMATQLCRGGVEVTTSGVVPRDTDLVVFSSAIAKSHASYSIADAEGVLLHRRGEVLAELAKTKKLVAIAGSHGKTTATAMLVTALSKAGVAFDFVLGGLFADENCAPAGSANSDWLVAEIDESDGTLDAFCPEITVVLNLDWDHADHYTTPGQLQRAFGQLLERTSGARLIGEEGACIGSVITEIREKRVTKTFGRAGDFTLEATETTSGDLGRQSLQLTGEFATRRAVVRARGAFNALNATAALATAQLMGVNQSSDLLEDFPGVHRRQATLRDDGRITVEEDYAHHPTEIRALLSSVRSELAVDRRLVVVFQPHRFSRTRQFLPELAEALDDVNRLHLLDVYAAGEKAIDGGRTQDLYEAIMARSPECSVNYVDGNPAAVLKALQQSRRIGDVVLFVGAGDIEIHARRWLDSIAKEDDREVFWDEIVEAISHQLGPETKVSREESLANKTTMRVGGPARVYAEPHDLHALQSLLRLCAARGATVHFLGRGSNLVVPDAGVEGVVVSLRHANWASFLDQGDGKVRVGAGLRLKNLCGLAAKAGLVGFEFLEGVPGNVGGALRMNAGAMGGWMFDVVESVKTVTRAGEVQEFVREDLNFGYRHCAELEDMMAVEAVLVSRGASETDSVARQIDVYRCKRQESQPRLPSAGCIFKNPEGDSAGRLIDSCGLKGARRGDAEVSTVHGNFIVNRGRAGSGDVVNLVRHVRSAVKQQTQVELEPEVLLYGARWEELL